MNGLDQTHQRAATSTFSTGIVLYQTWPQVQDDTDIRQFVMLLGKLCDALVGGNPPVAAQYMRTLRDRYTAYASGVS